QNPLSAWGNNASSLWGVAVYDKTAADGSDTNRMIFSSTVGTGTASRFAMFAGNSVSGLKNQPKFVCQRSDAGSGNTLSHGSERTDLVMMLCIADYENDMQYLYIDGELSDSGSISGTAGTNTSATDALYGPAVGGHAPTF